MLRQTLDDRFEQMPWSEIDNVVFDVGNVLVAFVPERLLALHVPERPDLHPALLRKIFRSPYWPMLDHGTVSTEEAITLMTGRDTELEPYIRRVMTGWPHLRETIPEGVRALEACKARGKRLYVLSNYHHEAFPVIDRQFDFFRLFDGMVISARVGLLKPSPEIYRHLTNTFGLTPERTLFIDDTPANIEGALYSGWQGLCFDAPGKLDRFLNL